MLLLIYFAKSFVLVPAMRLHTQEMKPHLREDNLWTDYEYTAHLIPPHVCTMY